MADFCYAHTAPKPGEENARLALMGAILGDIAGSTHEGKYDKVIPEALIGKHSRFTDDTVLTCACAEGLREGISRIDRAALPDSPEAQGELVHALTQSLRAFARRYPHAGYGSGFKNWFQGESMQGYNSYGNGAPMRCAFAGWYAKTFDEARLFGALTARPTHNHPDAEDAAAVVAACIYILKTGGEKRDLLDFARKYYDFSFTLNALRPVHAFNITARGTAIVAIACFLESTDFANTLGLAISMGGDTDTLAAIAGAIAEAFYVIPPKLLVAGLSRLDDPLVDTLIGATCTLEAEELWHPGQRTKAEPLLCHCQW